jgi:hypothetical protein
LRTACKKGEHRWTKENGRLCAQCGQRRTRMPKVPGLTPLRFGPVYCELCRDTLRAGTPVGWWPVSRFINGRSVVMKTAYCATCHSACVRSSRALKGGGGGKRQATRPRRQGDSLDGDRDGS